MSRFTRSALSKVWFAIVVSMFICVGLSSCSLSRSKIEVPVAKRVELPPPVQVEQPQLPYSRIDFDYPLTAVSHPQIYVYKSNRRLYLVNDGVLVRDYLIGLGSCPNGDKQVIGDGKTPEGDFFICTKNRWSKFYKSLGLNYPRPKDAEEGMLEGLISRDEYKCIIQANDNKCLPPTGTKLGGAIFIHGGGGYKDWTQGCIAISDFAMDELFDIIPVGTPVQVLP